jgi:AraC-like DNA-binding protein
MNGVPPAISGDFSVNDIVREAAARSVADSYVVSADVQADNHSMTGTIVVEEVQPGLTISAHDLTYTADGAFKVEMEPSISCAVLLEGESQRMEIAGYPPIIAEPKGVAVLGHSETLQGSRAWRSGQRSRAFGVTLRPSFFDRFGTSIQEDGLAVLRRFLEPGFRNHLLPCSRTIADLAERTLAEPYGGTLRTLHREVQALRFTVEIAAMLDSEQDQIRLIGRRHYDRVCEARAILESSLTDPPKVMDLARRLGVNVTTLQANFKAVFGTTVFGYVRARRLEMGRLLIIEHGLRVAEAGFKVGFTNAAAFSAAYRRHFGHPPTGDR